MNKEIMDYREAMFFGLDFRQMACSLLAVLAAVGIYFSLRGVTGEEVTGWLCMLGAAPFAFCGFFRYHGMTAEQFAWAFIKSEFLYPKRLLFQPEDLYYQCMEESILAGERRKKKAERKKEKRDRKKAQERRRISRKDVKKKQLKKKRRNPSGIELDSRRKNPQKCRPGGRGQGSKKGGAGSIYKNSCSGRPGNKKNSRLNGRQENHQTKNPSRQRKRRGAYD